MTDDPLKSLAELKVDYLLLLTEKAEQGIVDKDYDTFAKMPPERALPAIAAYFTAVNVYEQGGLLKTQSGVLNALKQLQQKQNTLVRDSLKSSEESATASKRFAICSLLVAIIAIVVSAITYHSSTTWQKEQIPLLQRIVDNATPTTQPKTE